MKAFPILFLFMSLAGFAQQDFVITTSRDTIYGKIIFPIAEEYNERIAISNDDGRQELRVTKILSCFVDGKEYQRVRYNSRSRIMEVIASGNLSHYKFRSPGERSFSIDFLSKPTGEGIRVAPLGFRKNVSAFLEGCNVLSEKVKNKEYVYKDLASVVLEYNTSCVQTVQNVYKIEKAGFQDLKELQTSLNEALLMFSNNEPVPDQVIKSLQKLSEKDLNASLLEFLKQLDN